MLEVEVNQKVYIHNKRTDTRSIETVVRETKTLYITNKDTRIKKIDGSIQGASIYSYTEVTLATKEHAEGITKRNLAQSIRVAARDDWLNFTVEELKAIEDKLCGI